MAKQDHTPPPIFSDPPKDPTRTSVITGFIVTTLILIGIAYLYITWGPNIGPVSLFKF